MKISVSDTALPGVRLIEPEIFTDMRGFFYESFNPRRFAEHGIDIEFLQDNHSRSRANVVRGLHYQAPEGAQWRLVRCTVGEVFDVVVDLRIDSPTLGKWIGVHLSAKNKHQLLIPPPFAHGFLVLSEVAEVQYKCSGLHSPMAERALAWDDPEVGIAWPLKGEPIISTKDYTGPSFRDYVEAPDFPAGWDARTPTAVHRGRR